LLPILSKVLERLVARHWILPYLSSSTSSSQFAYLPRSGGGAVTALTLMQHDILKFLDSSSGAVRLLSVDFARAFDKIPHSGIVTSCIRFGLPREAIAWIVDFLSNRFQRVKCKDSYSSWSPVSSGVPQGSVIGPLLFCMFVDNINVVCSNSSIFKYADDVSILHFVRSSREDHLQQELDNIMIWSESQNLPINFSKCKVLDVVTRKDLTLAPVSASNGDNIPIVTSITLLGVTMSSDLKWNAHVDTIVKKASKRIFLIRNLRRADCPLSAMFHAYSSFIRSVILYAYPSFCNAPAYLMSKLLVLERRVLRIMTGGKDHTFPSLTDAGEHVCQNLFQRVVSDASHPLRRCFVPRTCRTRTTKLLQPIQAKTTRFSSSFMRFGR